LQAGLRLKEAPAGCNSIRSTASGGSGPLSKYKYITVDVEGIFKVDNIYCPYCKKNTSLKIYNIIQDLIIVVCDNCEIWGHPYKHRTFDNAVKAFLDGDCWPTE